MGRFICLHYWDIGKREIWINTDAIVAVIDKRPLHGWTRIDTYAGAEGYCVEETAESVMGLIEQQTYVYPVPEPVNLVKALAEEDKEE